MPRAIGIDLRTTDSLIAAWHDGEDVVIPNAKGSRTNPSVVAFTEIGDHPVGQLACRQASLSGRIDTRSLNDQV